ncbi:hypothetical protein QRD89_01470 [Halobacillus sp. ACCC02827]|uniref:hypothetical protein n=1 Tax=Halobacillus sp. ACCC02827 TaxID=3052090 RepID=UPI00256FBFF5|nr:hypothetical protein [Halobacillus sp. ACCC02827]WJE16064.1 hypothetical protein QRD89_01470 [Halobacillus sp. ACCC02827]
MARDLLCLACNGEGLLMDDEEWRYTCKICGGSGMQPQNSTVYDKQAADVDETNRILD